MLKKLFIGSFSFASYAALLSAAQVTEPLRHQQEKPIIVFDIHGVLAKIAVWKMAKTIFWGLIKQPSLIFKLHPETFKSGAYVEHETCVQSIIVTIHAPRSGN
jgi:hypothetical protein